MGEKGWGGGAGGAGVQGLGKGQGGGIQAQAPEAATAGAPKFAEGLLMEDIGQVPGVIEGRWGVGVERGVPGLGLRVEGLGLVMAGPRPEGWGRVLAG